MNEETIYELGLLSAEHVAEINQYEQRIIELSARLATCQKERAHWKEVASQYREYIRGIYADATHLKKSIDESFEEFSKSFPEDTWSDE